jgi:predicted ferric reductase
MNRRIGILLLWLVITLPLLAALVGLQDTNLSSAAGLLASLGKLSGVMGLVLLLTAATLSARIPGFDIYFGGLTKLWKLHHHLAAASFLLLLLHPVLLALARANISIAAAADILVPASTDYLNWLGWMALLVMMVFLAPTFKFFGEPAYARWKKLHRLAGPAVILGLIHGIGLGSSLNGTVGVLVWLTLASLALAALLYRFFISRWKGVSEYRVDAVVPRANNVVELSLQALGQPLHYRAGQFVYFRPHGKTMVAGGNEEHPFTISSAPQESRLRITIKALGDATLALQVIAPGATASIEGPYGDFFPSHVSAEAQLWIAGGIGITPFLARSREIATASGKADVCLIYCVQDEARAYFVEELQQLATAIDGMQLVMHYFYKEGALDYDFIAAHCDNVDSRRVYVCGPGRLSQLARRILKKAGLPSSRLRTEEFNLL